MARVVRKTQRSRNAQGGAAARSNPPKIRGYQMARPGARVLISMRRVRWVFYSTSICLILAAVGHVAYSFMGDVPYFQLAKLKIEGVSEPVRAQLQKLIETASSSQSLLKLKTDDIEKKLAGALPRVRELHLEKLYPDTLLVRAQERQPSAIVNADGFYLLDSEGMVLEKLNPANLKNYDFPYITGLEPAEVTVGEKITNTRLYRALDLTRVLKERNNELFARFSEVNLAVDPSSGLDNITALLKGGLQVRFGDKDPVEKLSALELFIMNQQAQKNDPFAMDYVDLRFEGQIVFMDRATAVAAATGVLDKIREEQTQELEKNKKKNGKNSDIKADDALASDRHDDGDRVHANHGDDHTASDDKPERSDRVARERRTADVAVIGDDSPVPSAYAVPTSSQSKPARAVSAVQPANSAPPQPFQPSRVQADAAPAKSGFHIPFLSRSKEAASTSEQPEQPSASRGILGIFGRH